MGWYDKLEQSKRGGAWKKGKWVEDTNMSKVQLGSAVSYTLDGVEDKEPVNPTKVLTALQPIPIRRRKGAINAK